MASQGSGSMITMVDFLIPEEPTACTFYVKRHLPPNSAVVHGCVAPMKRKSDSELLWKRGTEHLIIGPMCDRLEEFTALVFTFGIKIISVTSVLALKFTHRINSRF